MSLFRVGKVVVMGFPALERLVLEYIYEKDHMDRDTIKDMFKAIDIWKKKIDMDRIMNRVEDEDEYRLGKIALMLVRDEQGEFDARKRLFKEKRIDWRKYHRLPGAITESGIIKAQETYREYAREHPEQEGLS